MSIQIVQPLGGTAPALTPTSCCLAAQFSTTLATAVATNLSLPIAADVVAVARFYLTVDAPASGMRFQITAPSGSVVAGWIISTQASLILTIAQGVAAPNTLGVQMLATARGTAEIQVRIANGATPGNVTLSIASQTAGQVSLVDAGSVFELTPSYVQA